MRFWQSFLLLALGSALFASAPAPEIAAAINLYRQKNIAAARAAFEQLHAADPANAEILHFLGLIAFREKRIDDAIAFHEKAVALAPQNPDYLLDLGESYSRKVYSASVFAKLGWAKKCHASIEKALALDPAHPVANAALAEYYFQAPGIAGGSVSKAYAQADAFKKLDLVGGTLLQVDLLRRQSRFEEMFAPLDAALAEHPDHYLLLLARGRASAASGLQLEAGARALERCLAQEPPPRAPGHAAVWFSLGEIHLKQNAPDAARAAFETALKRDPAHPDAAKALQKLERFK